VDNQPTHCAAFICDRVAYELDERAPPAFFVLVLAALVVAELASRVVLDGFLEEL
jgi:hypothetical protein